MVALTPSSTSAGPAEPVPSPVGAGASRLATIEVVGYAKRTPSSSMRPVGSTRSTAPGRSWIGLGASSTSNTRSKETNAVMISTRALVSCVRDRKSVVLGQGVEVSLDLGGRRYIKKKKTKQ